VLAAKEMGSIHARNILAGNIARSTKILLNQFNTTLKSGDPLKSGVILIPIPSRKSAVRRRGVDHAKTLASDVIEQIDHGLRSSKFESMEILQHTRTIRDQSGLNPIERQHNLQGSLSVDFKEILEINGRPVIVIDDVVTSGASIREAIRALHLVGIRPLGAVTACASPIHFPIR
jgi:predicted amidophosphoribosyltransferase